MLIHGLGGSIEAWHENVAPLGRAFTVYAVELPGHGKSDKPAVRYTLEFFADFIHRCFDAFSITSGHLAGLSFGGAAAIRFTLANPAMVDKLVLVSSAGLGPGMGPLFALGGMAPLRPLLRFVPRWAFGRYARSTVYDARKLPAGIVDFYYSLLTTRDFRRVMRSMLRENFTFFGHGGAAIRAVAAALHRLEKETLIVWGTNDAIIPVANAYRGNKKITHSRLVLFDHCAHNPQFEKADEFNTAVTEFLTGRR